MGDRLPAWSLPAGHPDLCPGSHIPVVHNRPGDMAPCVCGTTLPTYSAPSMPGGGRINAHYRPSLFDEAHHG